MIFGGSRAANWGFRNDRITFSYCTRRRKQTLFWIIAFNIFVTICYQLRNPSAVLQAENKYGYFDDYLPSHLRVSKTVQNTIPSLDDAQGTSNVERLARNDNPKESDFLPLDTVNLPRFQSEPDQHFTNELTAEPPLGLATVIIEDMPHDPNSKELGKEGETNFSSVGASILKEAKPVTMACKLPNLDPFSPAIRAYLETPDEVACENEDYRLLFKLEVDVLVRLKNLAVYDFDRCCISDITRAIDNDEDVEVSDKCSLITAARTKIPESTETFVVSCFYEKKSNWIDVDVFSIPRLRPEVAARIAQSPPSPEDINVVILGLDAVSHMNLQRTMPRTHTFLKQNLSAMYFDGHTKVGDNTFPNLMPALTGHSQEEIQASCWKNVKEFLDDCPYIWKPYSRKGYRTSYGEDLPLISTFNYLKNGFKSPPTDYYQRPMYLAQDLYIGHENLLNANVCYGPRLSFDVAFDYMKRLATLMGKDKRYFQFSWVNSLFHDYIATPSLADQSLLLLLIWFQRQGYLENTAFILMSDHGMRWGDLRETLQGKIEERMPFLYIVLPERFKSKYPAAIQNMQSNQNRLTTHFDTHETLLDLVFPEKLILQDLSQRTQQLDTAATPRGISLFLPIPLKRTCQDAGVDDHWCVCSRMVPLDVSSNIDVQRGAKAMLRFINTKLRKWHECSQLKIHELVRAQMRVTEDQFLTEEEDSEIEAMGLSPTKRISTNDTVINGNKLFEITIKTYPGLGVFEASVSKDIRGKYEVSGAISRTNLYGKQGHCVEESTIRLLCYCKDLEEN